MSATIRVPINTAPISFLPLPEATQPGEHYAALPNEEKDGWIHAHARQTILAEPQALYELWSDVTKFPLWQEHVVSVIPTTGQQSHWVVGNPEDSDGKRIEFESEITEDIPGQKIAWKSVSGPVDQSGEVQFHARRDGRGTVVTLIQHTKIGAIANTVASTAERGPRQTVIENLRHFKELFEAGEIPSVKGQPHGPRGISGSVKEWMYGETNPTPPGTGVAPEAKVK